MFTTIPNSKNYQNIIDQIKEAIVDGTLTVGSRLPTEFELAKQFSVSRSSVREALKALEVLGIVESRKGGGSFIVNNIGNSMTDTMSIYFMLKGGSIRDLVNMRVALELGALHAVIQNATGRDILALQQALDKYVEATSTEDRKIYDQNFHAVLISLAGNPLYDLILSALNVIFARDVSFSHQVVEDRGQLAESIRMHQAIFNAVKARDFPAASLELLRHFDFTDEDLARQSAYFYSNSNENPFSSGSSRR